MLLVLNGCTVGPRYVRPAPLPPNATPPATYKETPQSPPLWKTAVPAETKLRGDWWVVFGDPVLNGLEQRVSISNQNLKAALAQYDAAVEQARSVRSNLFPTITAGPQASRDRSSQRRPLLPASTAEHTTYNDFVLSGGFSYEIDAWGQIRHEVAQAGEQAQASAADLATANLSAHALMAQYYYQLRGFDTQQLLLNNTVEAYANLVQLTNNRFRGGIASEQDVAQARTQLDTTRGQAVDIGVARAQMEHAIAVLAGETASTFSIAPLVLNSPLPIIPPGLPSTLLERRPDVAAAERRVAAANEQIGIQRAAYFPVLTLNGNGGFESAAIGTLLQGPSSLWSLGGTAIQTIFDAGRRHALNAQARDQYDQQVAQYRQTSLVAFQQVEDNLAALRLLQVEGASYNEAQVSAQESVQLSINRYKGGVTNYIEVLTAEAALLNAQRTSADVLARQFIASVSLTQALGGGWDVSQLPGR